MARQSTGEETAEEAESTTSELWKAVRIDPVEIALPKGVGYTLRAYRPVTEVTPTDVTEREEDAFPERAPVLSEDESDAELDDELDEDDVEEEFDDDADSDEEEAEDEDEEEEEDEEEAAAEPEEVPVFLGKGGRLFLFRSPEGLVEFVKSGAEHDLTQLDTWPDVVEKITVEDVAPADEDSYELDLVVENLRGSRDSWDAPLLIQAGEVARDLGYALRIDSIIAALSADSPLDDLDEALRATESGGLGSFFARRKLKKIGAQAAPLGWRTIIGKISSAVDWRD